MDELHPKERTWREYCVSKPDKEKVSTFTKDERLISIGKVSQSIKQYRDAIDNKCKESVLVGFRDWHSKQKSISGLDKSYASALLALTVAHAVKTVHLSAPAEKNAKKRKALIDKAKARIKAANLGKARCVPCH